MSHYKFHPETWTDAQSQELCNQWYQEASFDKQSIKNPATKRKIQRGKARWDNIHRYCNKTVRKRFPDLFKQFEVETPTPLVLPDTTNLHKEIREIVKLWDTSNPLLDKISGYCPKHAGDCPALFPSTENTSLLCLEEKKEEEWAEESERFHGTDEKETKKELNGIATDFVTLYFFGTVETRLQFIKLVVTMFDFFLSELKDHDPHLFSPKNITLLFKGGVTLRLILRDLLKNFSGDLEQIIVYKLRKYIKISDYDFEIVSRKDLFDMDKNTITKFNMMTYLVVLAIRNYLLQHKLKFFNFFRLKPSEQRKKVQELKEKLQNHIQNIKNPNNPYTNVTIEHLQYGGDCNDLASGQFDTDLSPRKRRTLRNFPPKRGDVDADATSACRTDFALVVNPLVYTGTDSTCFITAQSLLKAYQIKNDTILNLPLQSRAQGSRLYATHNPMIYAESGSNVVMFNLNRIKYDFTLYCKKDGNLFRDSVVGEILDLSHAGTDDRRKSPGDVIPSDKRRPYKFFGYNVDFTSYSLQGFYTDLSRILFDETRWEPWTEVKYTKRLYRLIYVSILHFFSVDLKENLTFLERLQYLDAFMEALQKPTPKTNKNNNCPSASGDEPEDDDPEEGKYPAEPPRCGKERCPRVYAYRKRSGSGNLFENFAENMEKVRVKAVEKGIRGRDVYGDFINSTLLILTEIQKVLQAEYQLSRDPRFSVGSLYPLDLAIEFPAAYW